ncbi:MAG: glycosyltransferase family 1 protein [Sphingomonadales bacterium]|nr:MAG: glycosyltransferase family 1 protein [Sphingomonadales bacterium]
MTDQENNAPLLLDVTRQVWRRWVGVRSTGIDRICDAWMRHFAPNSQAVIITRRRQVILPVAASQALFAALAAPLPANGSSANFRRSVIAIALRWGWCWLRNLDGKGRFWLNAGHTGLHNTNLSDWCSRADVRPIYLVHDLIPITHPQYCRPGVDAIHVKRIHTVLKSATGVVANSQHTLDTLRAFANSVGMELPHAVVAWPGSARLHAEPDRSAPKSHAATFVILGTIEGRKNHALLLSVWKRLIAMQGDVCPTLIIVGRRGWEADDVFTLLETHDFQRKVIEAGPLDDEALAKVLGHANALLFPSHAEGFGIPLVEALAAGIPVIASDLAVFREIAGDIPELLAPDDEDAWIAALMEYARDGSTRRNQQIERMKGYVAPTWTEHFARIDKLLDKLSADERQAAI